MLHRMAWSSIVSPTFHVGQLNEVGPRWRRNNERAHVSGILVVTSNQFLGILEGDERDLDNLWLRLERDDRHRGLVRIGDAACGARQFPSWTLTYQDGAAVGRQIESLCSRHVPVASKWNEIIHTLR